MALNTAWLVDLRWFWVVKRAAVFVRVGFECSSPVLQTENGGVPFAEIAGPFPAEGVASDCTSGVSLREPMMWVIAYGLMGICAAVLIILLVLLILPCRCHRDGEITDESSLVRHRIKWRQAATEDEETPTQQNRAEGNSGQVTGWTHRTDMCPRSQIPVCLGGRRRDLNISWHLWTFTVDWSFSSRTKLLKDEGIMIINVTFIVLL